eukprot:jgi/Chlat1/1615/Chrsp127S01875
MEAEEQEQEEEGWEVEEGYWAVGVLGMQEMVGGEGRAPRLTKSRCGYLRTMHATGNDLFMLRRAPTNKPEWRNPSEKLPQLPSISQTKTYSRPDDAPAGPAHAYIEHTRRKANNSRSENRTSTSHGDDDDHQCAAMPTHPQQRGNVPRIGLQRLSVREILAAKEANFTTRWAAGQSVLTQPHQQAHEHHLKGHATATFPGASVYAKPVLLNMECTLGHVAKRKRNNSGRVRILVPAHKSLRTPRRESGEPEASRRAVEANEEEQHEVRHKRERAAVRIQARVRGNIVRGKLLRQKESRQQSRASTPRKQLQQPVEHEDSDELSPPDKASPPSPSYSPADSSSSFAKSSKPAFSASTRVLAGKYQVLGIVGEGAYGMVSRCRNTATGEVVAIKEFKTYSEARSCTTEGEWDALERDDVPMCAQMLTPSDMTQALPHPNIVKYREHVVAGDKLLIVMEFVPRNLLELLESAGSGGLPKEDVRKYIGQLCNAIAFMHQQNTVYRDIKPENLLISEDGVLKLCDFGFARRVAPKSNTPLTDYVATRWYRAPELLLGTPYPQGPPVSYDGAVDMWAVGCLMGELLSAEPLLAGDSDLDQLHKIVSLLGPLAEDQMASFNANPNNEGVSFPSASGDGDHDVRRALDAKFNGALTAEELNFIVGLLQIDPKQRLTSAASLQHPYLQAEVRPMES